jgi:predicted CXXCH cytochrome family protein
MKNLKVMFGAAALVGIVASGANAQTGGGIANSRHNFSSFSWSGGEICKPCHTPHFANGAAGALWNHALTNATYTMFGGTPGTAAADLDSVSRLCMSCHDGTVALDSFGGATGTSTIGPAGLLGTNLENSHPLGSKAIYPTTTSTRFNAQNTSHKVVSTAGSLSLYAWVDTASTTQYVVGCKTCHDPHNNGTGAPSHMLKFSNSGSQLCLTCHIK